MLPSQNTPVEFFGLPFDDKTLHDARLRGSHGILTACSGVLQEIGKGDVYNNHLDLASKWHEAHVKKEFLMALSKLSPQDQQKCFDNIVDKLQEGGPGLEHIKDRLIEGTCIFDNSRFMGLSLFFCLSKAFILPVALLNRHKSQTMLRFLLSP